MIEIKEGRYFAAVAYVYGKRDQDWFAAAWRDLPDGPWILDYRFRYYRDGKAFDSDDRKSCYSAVGDPGTTEAKCLLFLRHIAETLIKTKFNDRLDFVELRTADPKKILEILKGRPWMHLKDSS